MQFRESERAKDRPGIEGTGGGGRDKSRKERKSGRKEREEKRERDSGNDCCVIG